MQLYPSLMLSAIVKHYLIIKHDHDGYADYRLFSDGNLGLVFHFKDPFLQVNAFELGSKQPYSFLYGQMTHFNDIKSVGKLDMLIVVLHPHGLHALTNLSAYELNNTITPLRTVFGQEGSDMEAQVLSSKSPFP